VALDVAVLRSRVLPLPVAEYVAFEEAEAVLPQQLQRLGRVLVFFLHGHLSHHLVLHHALVVEWVELEGDPARSVLHLHEVPLQVLPHNLIALQALLLQL
jgi:hypothetical protein